MNLVQRARPGVVLARALEGDVEAVAVDEVATSTLASVLPSVGVACLGSLLFGYHLAVVNPALAPLSLELGISAARTQGFVVSAALVGACVGSFQAGALADTLGRRGALRVASVPLLLGALACGAAPSTGALLAGRLLAGLGLGLASGVVPVYISEVAPPALRGALGSANQLCICLGLLAAIVAGLPVAANPELWRACFYAAALPAALLMLGSGLILESPAWAARKPGGEAGASGWAELGCAQHRRATVLAVGLFALQQLAGINAVVFFSNAVFKAAGVQSEVLASSGVALVNVLGTLVAARVVDQAGRKPLLLGSFTGMALSMAALSAALSLPQLASVSGSLAVGCTVLYVASFALGAGPLPAVLVSELFPAKLRGTAMSAALLSHWACNVLVGQTFLALVEASSVGTVYASFALVCALAVFFVSARLPETKGREYAEVAALLSA